MTVSPSVLWGPTGVPSSATAVYTSPASTNTTTVITRAFVTNQSNAASTLTIWVVRSGLSRANSNIVFGAAAAGQSIAAGPSSPTVIDALAGLVLAPGDAIHVVSNNANDLNFTGSGWTQA